MYRINILEYLEEAATEHADKTAFSDGTDSLSFCELRRMSQSVGSFLFLRGNYRSCILILMEKHPRTLAAMLGAVYSGCFYTVLDSSSPKSRIERIAERVKPSAIIYDEKNEAAARELPVSIPKYPYGSIPENESDADALSRVRERALDTDLVYVVFTSGSTGEPKGVAATHRSVIDYAESLSSAVGFSESSIFASHAPLCLDAPLKEIMATLKLGATTYFVPKALFLSPVRLCRFLERHRVNTLCWAVSALTIISSLGALDSYAPRHIDTVCFGGEVFAREDYERWRRAYPTARFVNLYGPTEATGMSCYWIADRTLAADEPIPIGKPFRNTEILLIGENMKRAADGEVGEIYIRGSCVTAGYFADDGRTAAAFVQNPLNSDYPDRVYRTGDMARLNEYGELVFLGRRDMQIKHMGHRVELGEIELAARELGGVVLACAKYDASARKIMLFYTGEASEREVLCHLKGLLPGYMIPSKITKKDNMPLTASGKADRSAL